MELMREQLAEFDEQGYLFQRPEWIAHRDLRPIEPLSDHCVAHAAANAAA